MDIWYYLMIPFSWLLKFFYNVFNSYGLALILLSLVVKVVLFPLSIKGKKSMIEMNMLSGRVKKIQKQYGSNTQRANEEIEKLYEKEGVNPMGGCMWSMIPLVILFPLYAVVRRPMKYLVGLPDAAITAVTEAVAGTGVALSKNYPEINMIANFHTDSGLLATAQAAAGDVKLFGLNFNFFGINLADTPDLMFWKNGITWNSIGLALIPVVCAVTAFLSTQIMNKTNQMNNDQPNQQNQMMTLMSPVMMLVFSFIMPVGMGIYIIANSVFSVVQELLCAKILKKDYEKAAEEAKRREIEEKEEEKRLRREKAEAKARKAEEARKNKGKTLPDPDEDKIPPEVREASRSGIRQYARGRGYDPARFGSVTAYDEKAIAAMLDGIDEYTGGKKKKKKAKKDNSKQD